MEEGKKPDKEKPLEEIDSIEILIRYTTKEGKSFTKPFYPSVVAINEENKGIVDGEATFEFTIKGTYSIFVGNPGSMTLEVSE